MATHPDTRRARTSSKNRTSARVARQQAQTERVSASHPPIETEAPLLALSDRPHGVHV